MSWSLSVGAHHWLTFFAQHKLLSATLGIAAGTGFNYALCCLVVFRANSNGTVASQGVPKAENAAPELGVSEQPVAHRRVGGHGSCAT